MLRRVGGPFAFSARVWARAGRCAEGGGVLGVLFAGVGRCLLGVWGGAPGGRGRGGVSLSGAAIVVVRICGGGGGGARGGRVSTGWRRDVPGT